MIFQVDGKVKATKLKYQQLPLKKAKIDLLSDAK